MKYILGFLLGFLLGACATVPAPKPREHVVAAATIASKTVAIVVGDFACAGVWVGPDRIITAAHCVDDLKPGDVVAYATHDDVFPDPANPTREADPIPARVSALLASDIDHDLALLLATKAPRHGVAEVRTAPVEAGAFSQTMGHPKGLWWSYSSGDVAALREKDTGDGRLLVWVQSTAPISPGSSGGGLFDAEGRLIGVATAIVNGASNVALFVPAAYVARLLARP